MFGSASASSVIGRGILAIIIGLIAIVWPGVTVFALVILFAIYAFMDGGLQVARAFASRSAGPILGHLLLALVDFAAGLIAIVWPGVTALVLVIVVSVWAFASGVAEIFAGFGKGETAGQRTMLILAGAISILFGIVLFAHPGIGALTLALVFGLFSFVYGVTQTTVGLQMRHAHKEQGQVAGHESK
jgi:uncharacterized membrane protein HdeD (DUF308 family)